MPKSTLQTAVTVAMQNMLQVICTWQHPSLNHNKTNIPIKSFTEELILFFKNLKADGIWFSISPEGQHQCSGRLLSVYHPDILWLGVPGLKSPAFQLRDRWVYHHQAKARFIFSYNIIIFRLIQCNSFKRRIHNCTYLVTIKYTTLIFSSLSGIKPWW